MKKYILLSTMGLVLLAACSDDPSTTGEEEPADSGPVTVTDQAGNEVTIPEDPSRIVASYLEDPLVTLGITPVRQWSVLERSSTQVYLEEQLAGIEPIDFNLPLEALMEADPDLVFASGEDSMASGSYDQYSKIAPTYVIDNETKDDWRATLTLMGEVLGKEAEAETAISEYDAHVADMKNQLNEEIGDSKVAALWLLAESFLWLHLM